MLMVISGDLSSLRKQLLDLVFELPLPPGQNQLGAMTSDEYKDWSQPLQRTIRNVMSQALSLN